MKKNAYLNVICSLLAQFTTVLCGLIIPRLILSTFGSDVNGMVSSLTQFLNYISLLEGGLGNVVLAALYKPLSENDNEKLSSVLVTANNFFKKIAIIFIGYTFIVAFGYTFLVNTSFNNMYIISLVIILSIGLFIQFFFSVTYKLLLQADQKMYIVQIVQIVMSISSLLVTYYIINIFPNIHIVKLFASMIYLIQPIAFKSYVEKNYSINRKAQLDNTTMAQRWDCFGQNLAYFINTNTDVVILTLMSELKIVSVYSVYYLFVNNIKNVLQVISNAFSPIIGGAIAREDINKANAVLDIYEFLTFNLSTIVWGISINLLPSFIMIYTKGVVDADYYQPLFSIILILAFFVYNIREPYIVTIYAAGKFRETSISAYIEAMINITISVLFVKKIGLIGIAIGTFLAVLYRMLYQVWYLHNNVIHRRYNKIIKRVVTSIVVICISDGILNYMKIWDVNNLSGWIKTGFLSIFIYIICALIVNCVFDKNIMKKIIEVMKNDT